MTFFVGKQCNHVLKMSATYSEIEPDGPPSYKKATIAKYRSAAQYD